MTTKTRANKKLNLEVAVFSGQAALTAQAIGANRVELNAPGSYSHGGLTPPVHELMSITQALQIPVRIMIRPRGDPNGRETLENFMYTEEELAQMEAAIVAFKAAGHMNPVRGDGFVFGILTHANDRDRATDVAAAVSVDIKRCQRLIETAKPYPCIFHRAFDPIADNLCREQGLRDLIVSGFKGVLTSGGFGPHSHHLSRLDAMACWLRNHKDDAGFQLIVGGGVRAANAADAVAKLGTHPKTAVWMHSACLTNTEEHPGEIVDDQELNDLLGRLELAQVE